LQATGTGSCEHSLSAGESKSLREEGGALVDVDFVGERRDQVGVMDGAELKELEEMRK
jgi:hypothetical protein